MASNKLIKKIGEDHRETIRDDLKGQFYVNNQCLDCVEVMSRTFVDMLIATLYLFSCLSHHKGQDDKDRRGINRLVSVMVCQHDGQNDSWRFLKGNDLKGRIQ